MNPLSFDPSRFKKVSRKKDVQSLLFDVEMEWGCLKEGHCPRCARKLYWFRDQSRIHCKNKMHAKFILSKEMYDDIISGKRLAEFIKVTNPR